MKAEYKMGLIGIVIGLLVGGSTVFSIIMNPQISTIKAQNEELGEQVSTLRAQALADATSFGATSQTMDSFIVGLEAALSVKESEIEELEANITLRDSEISLLEAKTGYSLNERAVNIGVISSTSSSLENLGPLYKDIIEPDINDYCRELGYNVTFEFHLSDAQGSAAVHLEKVMEFHELGVDLIIGGRWSSLAQSALSYVNENDILLFSPSSSSPLLAIPDDNLFRMCPDDQAIVPAVSEMIRSWGIEACLVIQRADAWGDSIYNVFEEEFPEKGGVIIGRIRYAGEVTEFSSYLDNANDIITEAITNYGAEKVGILIISFSESVTIVTQASDYPALMGIYWFGTDGTALSGRHTDDAPEVSDHLKLFSPLPAPASSPKFDDFHERYHEITGEEPDFYTACDYDIAWAIAKAVLEAQSTDPSAIIPVLQGVCDDMFGVSGWCRLNEDGDRRNIDYGIWGVGYEDGEYKFIKYGVFHGTSEKVTWDWELVTPRTSPPRWGG